jgi:CheY-like chemotaxis protein
MQVAVAILGFGEFERDALSFCVRNALTSDVDYELCDSIEQADLIVADADASGVIDSIVQAARTPHVVFVGKTDVPGAVSHVPRPIDPARVLRCLDEMAADVMREHIVAWSETAQTPLDTPFDALVEMPVELPADVPGTPHETDPRINTKAQVRRAVRRAQRAGAAAATLIIDALVLDADAADRAALSALLERFGFVVHAAANMAQATELLAQHSYAAAFLEVVFDGSDSGAGVELCRRVKETEAALALIVVTGRLDPSDHVRARLAGADVHLTKPLGRGDVARSLEGCGVGLPADARRA